MSNLNKYVTEMKGQAITTSRKVAGVFGKRHDHVLRDIANITDPKSGVSNIFINRNFKASRYKDRTGRKLRQYIITKDGFMFLVMGYTGERAAKIKEAYINEFNLMADIIQTLKTARFEFPALTQSILQAHEEPKPYHYSNEMDMINRIVLGQTAKQFKASHGIDKNVKSIRPYLRIDQIQAIEALQRADVGMVLAVPDFQTRKEFLTRYYHNLQVKTLSA